MKKEERLYRLLGDIDDDLVADATRKPARKGVWMPLVAAAACVALTVGLWQGGVFDPATPPVDMPGDTTSTTESTEPYILVGGEDDSSGFLNEDIPSLKTRLVSETLEEKMEEYRNVNAVYQVVVSIASTIEDWDEWERLIDADEDYQALKKQSEEAHKTANKAYARYFKYRGDTLKHEAVEATKKANKIDGKITELKEKSKQNFFDALEDERISYAAKYSKTEPISGYGFGLGHYDSYPGYYMELTADAINELADRGGYVFMLASDKNHGIFRE